VADVVHEGQRAGMAFEQRFDIPANNLMLVFRRGAGKVAVAWRRRSVSALR
jgi:hypothetical protein